MTIPAPLLDRWDRTADAAIACEALPIEDRRQAWQAKKLINRYRALQRRKAPTPTPTPAPAPSTDTPTQETHNG